VYVRVKDSVVASISVSVSVGVAVKKIVCVNSGDSVIVSATVKVGAGVYGCGSIPHIKIPL
jgi:hypothetical protein